MASGKVHARVATTVLITTAALAVVNVAEGDSPILWGTLLAGEMLGLLLTPDIDLPGRTHEEWRLLKRLPIIGKLWLMFWAGYGQGFKHRGVSHWPIIGTATRLLWLFSPLLLFNLGLAIMEGLGWADVYWWPGTGLLMVPGAIWLAFLAGWVIQDLFHLLLDGMLFPRRRKKKRKKFKAAIVFA